MNDIVEQLTELISEAPDGLEARTVFEAGASDRVARAESPIGDVWVAWSSRGITALSPVFESNTAPDFITMHRRHVSETTAFPRELGNAIAVGLSQGETVGLPIDYRGLTPFQTSVLEVCAQIPPGVVHPYNWIATTIDNKGAIRAVGTALGTNPIPLLVPCHRVVRSDGAVGNYAFGAEMKHELLVREGAILA